MRELPFGARISDSFVKKLKWETAKANAESPDVLPCLCIEEKRRYETLDSREAHATRIAFEEGPEIPAINRLVHPTWPPVMLIKERVWVLYFDSRKHPAFAPLVERLWQDMFEEVGPSQAGATR